MSCEVNEREHKIYVIQLNESVEYHATKSMKKKNDERRESLQLSVHMVFLYAV